MRGRGEGRREEGRIRCDSDWNGLGAGREEIRNIYTDGGGLGERGRSEGVWG